MIPEEIQQQIYFYKHNLEYVYCMDELIQIAVYSTFNFTALELTTMYYMNQFGEKVKCLNIKNLHANPHNILNAIRKCK
jgi:hypothetical protein